MASMLLARCPADGRTKTRKIGTARPTGPAHNDKQIIIIIIIMIIIIIIILIIILIIIIIIII